MKGNVFQLKNIKKVTKKFSNILRNKIEFCAKELKPNTLFYRNKSPKSFKSSSKRFEFCTIRFTKTDTFISIGFFVSNTIFV